MSYTDKIAPKDVKHKPVTADLAAIGRAVPKVVEEALGRMRDEKGYIYEQTQRDLQIMAKEDYGQLGLGMNNVDAAKKFQAAFKEYALDLAMVLAAGGNSLDVGSDHINGNKDLRLFTAKLDKSHTALADALSERNNLRSIDTFDTLRKISRDMERSLKQELSAGRSPV